MDEEIAKVAMNLIFYSGNAKSNALMAIKAAFKGDAETAKKQMESAHVQLNQAHNLQTGMMTDEITGKQIEKSIILIHAQDQFMAANTIIELGELLISYAAEQK